VAQGVNRFYDEAKARAKQEINSESGRRRVCLLKANGNSGIFCENSTSLRGTVIRTRAAYT